MFWHADKSLYQQKVANSIADLLRAFEDAEGIDDEEKEARQKLWIEAFLYIFCKHWNKVDNFCIDNFMMLVSLQLNQCL